MGTPPSPSSTMDITGSACLSKALGGVFPFQDSKQLFFVQGDPIVTMRRAAKTSMVFPGYCVLNDGVRGAWRRPCPPSHRHGQALGVRVEACPYFVVPVAAVCRPYRLANDTDTHGCESKKRRQFSFKQIQGVHRAPTYREQQFICLQRPPIETRSRFVFWDFEWCMIGPPPAKLWRLFAGNNNAPEHAVHVERLTPWATNQHSLR